VARWRIRAVETLNALPRQPLSKRSSNENIMKATNQYRAAYHQQRRWLAANANIGGSEARLAQSRRAYWRKRLWQRRSAFSLAAKWQLAAYRNAFENIAAGYSWRAENSSKQRKRSMARSLSC